MKIKLLKKRKDYRTIYDPETKVYWIKKKRVSRPIGATLNREKINTIILKDLSKCY